MQPILEPTNQSHRILVLILVILLTAGAIGGGVYYVLNQQRKKQDKLIDELQKKTETKTEEKTTQEATKTEPSKKTLSNDEIYEEVSLQLGIKRDKIAYFRIFGQDRVQFSFGRGANFMYKADIVWNFAGGQNTEAMGSCAELDTVPEKYRPACYTIQGVAEKYIADGENINYPASERTSYIGE